MFFIMGINSDEKKLDFSQMVICSRCGKYGRYEVFMHYMVLSLFFIPLFKWNKRYFVRSKCCNAVYELPKELGQRIARGEKIEISDGDLIWARGGYKVSRRCGRCGFATDEEFEFCPKCGEKLEDSV